jgi:hypothetical protein
LNTDNAAGRLYDVLQGIIHIPLGGKCIDRLAVFFDLAPTPESLQGHNVFPLVPKLIHRVTEIIKLTDEAERELDAIEGLNKELYLTPFPHIRNTVCGLLMNLYTAWNNYSDEFKKTDFRGLQFCSDTLSKFSIEQPIDRAVLLGFLDEVDQFYEQVLASEIHWETKYFILDRLDEVRAAIREYHIRGVEGLRECIGKTIGLIFVNPHVLESPDEGSPKAKAKNKLSDLLTRFSAIIDLGIKAQQLGERLKPLIAPGWAIVKGLLGPGDPPA